MKREVLEKLIEKFISGTITADERRNLEKWYSSFEKDKGFTERLSDAEKEEMENSLFQKINKNIAAIEGAQTKEEKIPVPHIPLYSSDKNTDRFPVRFKIAAGFIAVVILAALSFQLVKEKTVIHTTSYGQILPITLPDSSTVILNGNSQLSYNKGLWSGEQHRAVYLEGEAFFSVRHTEHDQKFIVHTSDAFNVEVLGTEFNVSKRKHGTRVVLNAGKVRLNFKKPTGNDQVLMKPGDLIAFQNGAAGFMKKKVDAAVYSSWKDGKLLLDHTSLREILVMLQDNYGLSITVSDKALLDQKISGSIPFKNIKLLLGDIAEIYQVEISRNKNDVKIQKHPNRE